jgi:tetratricopeptide (TPR) repeat protein
MTGSDVCVQCGSPRPPRAPDGLCPRCRGEPRPGTRVLRLLAIVVVLVTGGIGTAAYFGYAAHRQREATIAKVGNSAAHFDRALALQKQGKLAEAIEEYRAAIRIIPGSAEAHYNLGVALWSQGDSAAAVAEFRKARDFAQGDARLTALIDRALAQAGH